MISGSRSSPTEPARSDGEYRLLIRRQRIEVRATQGELFDLGRYRFAVTNLPASECSAGAWPRRAHP